MNDISDAIKKAWKTEHELTVVYMTQKGRRAEKTYPMRNVLSLLNKIEGMKYAIDYKLNEITVGSTEL